MAIREKNNVTVPFKGDYMPMATYAGDKVIFEPKETTKRGETLPFENTYNDVVQKLTVQGKSVQDKHRLGVLADKIVQFEDGKEGGDALVEVKANPNLILGVRNFPTETDEPLSSWGGYTLLNLALIPDGIHTYQVTITFEKAGKFHYSNENGTEAKNSYTAGTHHISVQVTNSVHLAITYDAYEAGDIVKVHHAKLELGSTPTPWLPHVDDGLPTPSVEVTRCGRNLFKDFIYNKAYVNGTTVSVNPDGVVTVDKKSGDTIVQKTPHQLPEMAYTLSNGLSTGGVVYLQAHNSLSTIDVGSLTKAVGVKELVLYSASNSVANVTLYPQLELGTVAHPYEPYQGDTYTIPYNTPTKIPLLNGVNSIFANEDVQLDVLYEKSESATPLPTDITVPTDYFPLAINSAEGEIASAGRTDAEKVCV